MKFLISSLLFFLSTMTYAEEVLTCKLMVPPIAGISSPINIVLDRDNVGKLTATMTTTKHGTETEPVVPGETTFDSVSDKLNSLKRKIIELNQERPDDPFLPMFQELYGSNGEKIDEILTNTNSDETRKLKSYEIGAVAGGPVDLGEKGSPILTLVEHRNTEDELFMTTGFFAWGLVGLCESVDADIE